MGSRALTCTPRRGSPESPSSPRTLIGRPAIDSGREGPPKEEARHTHKPHRSARARSRAAFGRRRETRLEHAVLLVIVEEGFPAHQLVVLGEAAGEEVANGRVVREHEPADAVRGLHVG